MHIPVSILKQATKLYVDLAYPDSAAGSTTVPAGVQPRVDWVRNLEQEVIEPESSPGMLERDAANSVPSYALRLGQPKYPHMKLMLDPAPVAAGAANGAAESGEGGGGGGGALPDFILRVDSHDRHLHAPAGSPDAAWLESIRMSNKELGERIEAAWAAAGLPTFKEFLRRQLEARKQAAQKG